MSEATPCCITTVSNFTELNFALGIRAIVFIEEQACPFDEEFDTYDRIETPLATHLLVMQKNKPVATARILYLDQDRVKLGRLAVLKAYRGQGIGKEMLEYMLNFVKKEGYSDICLNAQAHLSAFYEKSGFKGISELFDEAGIPHITMQYHRE